MSSNESGSTSRQGKIETPELTPSLATALTLSPHTLLPTIDDSPSEDGRPKMLNGLMFKR